jgi:hypothetical protein
VNACSGYQLDYLVDTFLNAEIFLICLYLLKMYADRDGPGHSLNLIQTKI